MCSKRRVWTPPEHRDRMRAPNMRLKQSGLLVRESAVASPGAPPRGGPVPCASAHAARSLSAIR